MTPKQEAQWAADANAKSKAQEWLFGNAPYTPAPSGLSITRNGNNLTFSWKLMGDNYGDGQQLQYRFNNGNWISVAIGTKTTQKAITIPVDSYYPVTGTKLQSVTFRVRGNKKAYKKEFSSTVKYKVKVNGKDTVKEVAGKYTLKLNPTWSDWADKRLVFAPPPAPNVSAALSEDYTNVTTFSWSVNASANGAAFFRQAECQQAFVANSNITDGASIGSWARFATTGTSGSRAFTEDSTTLATGNSYTRWVRVRSRGVAGDSGWVYAKHIYAQPHQASNVRVSASVTPAGGFSCKASWRTTSPVMRPIDKITCQYTLAVPEPGLNCPSGASWGTGQSIAFRDGTDSTLFSIYDTLNEDQCLFIRVNTEHDAIYDSNYGKTFGVPVFASAGRLKAPTGLSVEADSDTYRAVVTATNRSGVEDSFLAVLFQWSKAPNQRFVVGVIPPGEDTTTVQCPNWTNLGDISFGVYAVVGNYRRQTRSDGADSYSITAYSGKSLMTSPEVWDGGQVALAPAHVTAESTNVRGSARVSWDWNWSLATGAEVSWSDHEDAWESTDEPHSYVVGNLHKPTWNIANLELGKTWYIRVRFVRDTGDAVSHSVWSRVAAIDLSAPPENPALELSAPYVVEDGEVTASWSFTATDGAVQASAEICTASISGGKITYGRVIARATTERSLVLNAADLGWESGQTYNLCVKVTSTSGRTSEKWSDPVSVIVVPRLLCSIAGTSLVSGVLTQMPLTVTADAQPDVTYTLAIERAHSYYMERPDESIFEGHEGETVALADSDSGNFTITLDDLAGTFDDGAPYRILLTAADKYGQSAEAVPLYFEVHWAHQATLPMASAWTDSDDYITMIRPVAPEGLADTDRCDIYRLSADKPVLIVQDAEWGVDYVDPYPTIGSHGGHRIVTMTANGDCIDGEDRPAWIDLREPEGDYVELDQAIIDFGEEQIALECNIEVSHSWKKDFKETKYLGGAVQGDWNPAISRKLSLNAALVRPEEDEQIRIMRKLASYPGLCHVRTPDGSSFAADIQVSEDSSYASTGRVVNFSLAITRVDPEGLEGMTYDDWVSGIAAEYRYDIDEGDLYESAKTPSGYTFEVNAGGDLELVFDNAANDDINFDLVDGKLVVIYEQN